MGDHDRGIFGGWEWIIIIIIVLVIFCPGIFGTRGVHDNKFCD